MEGAERVGVDKFKGGRGEVGELDSLLKQPMETHSQQASLLFPKRGKPLHSLCLRLFPRGVTHGKWTQGSWGREGAQKSLSSPGPRLLVT